MIVIGLFFFILEQMLEIITIQLRAFLEAQHKVVKDIIFSLIKQVARRWRPVECGRWQVLVVFPFPRIIYLNIEFLIFGKTHTSLGLRTRA